MAVIDSTNTLENAMFLKSKVSKNMVGENYYIQTLQQKIDNEWEYRYNRFDIDEEAYKQINYKPIPTYKPIEVVLQTVKNEKNQDISKDWKKVVFKELEHPNYLGKRYRFSLDFEKNPTYTEEQKQKECSIWITVNMEKMSPTNGAIIRRCNTNVGFVGSPTMERSNITEVHYEPCILESDFKYINIYYNSYVTVPQAEIYAIFQYNWYTQNIQINNRFVIGDTDIVTKSNNNVYKVKAIQKFGSDSTFKVGNDLTLSDVPLIMVALDKDNTADVEDNFKDRIASQTTMYRVIDKTENTNVIPEVVEETDNIEIPNYIIRTNIVDVPDTILFGESKELTFNLYNNEILMNDIEFLVEGDLLGTESDSSYFELTKINNNNYIITNKKTYLKSNLRVKISCKIDTTTVEKNVEFKLGGFY
jgi:hypothetical protein